MNISSEVITSFIIWALPNSDGIQIAEALGSLYPQAQLKLNPFNPTGEHPVVLTMASKNGAEQIWKQQIKKIVKTKSLILHEVSGRNKDEKLNMFLAELTTEYNYRHILIYRRDTLHRLLLKHREATVQQFAENPSQIALPEIDSATLRKKHKQELIQLLLISHLLPSEKLLIIAREDLTAEGNATTQLFNFLNLNKISPEQRYSTIINLNRNVEPSFSYLTCYPGFSNFQYDVRLLPGFEEDYPFSKPVVESLKHQGLDLFRPDSKCIPLIIAEGATLAINGIALPPLGFQINQGAELYLKQGGKNTKIIWRLPSPGVKNLFPNHPLSARYRYKKLKIRVNNNIPALIELHNNRGGVDLAQVRFESNNGRNLMPGIFMCGNNQLGEWKIGYLPIPKIASTSIYNGLYNILTGHYYEDEDKEGSWRVHQYFQKKHADISGAQFRFVVVRDPIKRFLSGYVNRVLDGKELSRPYIEKLENAANLDLDHFPYNPTLSEFIKNFEFYYQSIPTISHHFRSQHEFIINLERFNHVYPIEQLEQLSKDIHQYCGVSLQLTRKMMKSKSKITVANLTNDEFEKIKRLYVIDYEILANIYSPDKLLPLLERNF